MTTKQRDTASATSPTPGIYASTHPIALAYRELDAVNFSTIKHLARSALHYAHAVRAERAPTVPMRLGAVAHCLALEPLRFAEQFAVWDPPGKKPNFSGKEYVAFRDAHPNHEIVKPAEVEAGRRIAAAIRTSRTAQRYMSRGRPECVMIWRDEVTGMLCKARPDFVSDCIPNLIVELKTARDISPWAFASQYAKLSYHVQTAWYLWGLATLTGKPAYAKCVAVENTEPHDVITYSLTDVVDLGAETLRKWLTKLAELRAADSWPGQSPDVEIDLQLPRYMLDDEDEDGDLTGLGLEGMDAEDEGAAHG